MRPALTLTTVRGIKDFLKENQPEVWEREVLPPSLHNFKLFGYFVCGVSELKVNAKPHNKIEDLIQKMKAVMGSLDRGTVAKAL